MRIERRGLSDFSLKQVENKFQISPGQVQGKLLTHRRPTCPRLVPDLSETCLDWISLNPQSSLLSPQSYLVRAPRSQEIHFSGCTTISTRGSIRNRASRAST